MSVKIFAVTCTHCGSKQQVWTNKKSPLKNNKECVYCGKKFIIKKENIIGRVK